jgi:nicotinamidase-related amidase
MDARTTAVLLVHLQPDIVEPEGAFGPVFAAEASRRQIVGRARALADTGRAAGATVVFLRIAFAADHSDLDATMPLLQMVADAKALREGDPRADLVADLDVRAEDEVVTHRRPGPFTGSSLDDVLRRRGITSVAVAGVATNVSVESTVRQAADLGYRCTVMGDVCSAADPAAHEASLGSMALFAHVSDTPTFLSNLT